MAKKRRHRIWWFFMFPDAYQKLLKERTLPVPTILFDKPEMAYSMGYADRFEPVLDADGNHVTVSDYAQLKDQGRITVIGIHGDVIDWKQRGLAIEKLETGNIESVFLEQPIKLTDKAVHRIMEESDEMYAKHLQSPLARAGGVTVPQEVKDRIEARRVAEEAKREIEEQCLREAEAHGEDDGSTVDSTPAEVCDSPA